MITASSASTSASNPPPTSSPTSTKPSQNCGAKQWHRHSCLCSSTLSPTPPAPPHHKQTGTSTDSCPSRSPSPLLPTIAIHPAKLHTSASAIPSSAAANCSQVSPRPTWPPPHLFPHPPVRPACAHRYKKSFSAPGRRTFPRSDPSPSFAPSSAGSKDRSIPCPAAGLPKCPFAVHYSHVARRPCRARPFLP